MSNDLRNHQHLVGPFHKQQRQDSQHDSRMTSFTMNSTTGSKTSSYSVPRSVSNDDEEDDIIVNENDINYGNVPQLLSTTRIHSKNSIPLQSTANTTSISCSRSIGSRNSIINTNSAKPGARSALSTEVGLLSSSLLNKIGTNNSTNNTDAKNMLVEQYLLSYEAMVQQQTREEQSVMEHMVPCITRFKEILEKLNNDSNMNTDHSIQSKHHQQRKKMKQTIHLYDEISYQQLYQVYNYLQQLKTTSHNMKTDDTFTQISLYECMTTDRQLMMILRTLTEDEASQHHPHQTNDLERITWIEFIHCYRICILGMMALQHLPKGSLARIRVRERSLSMIHLFRENGRPTFHQHRHDINGPSPKTNLTTDPLIAPNFNFTTTSTTSASSTIQHLIPLLNDPKSLILTGATNSMDTARRRRRWLKKRTRRALPYLVVIMILLVAFFYIGLRHSNNMTPRNNFHERDTVGNDSILEQCMIVTYPDTQSANSNTADSQFFGNSQINDIVTYDFMDNDDEKDEISFMNYSLSTIDHPAIEERLDVTFYHPERRQYHPLLGIWSNFI